MSTDTLIKIYENSSSDNWNYTGERKEYRMTAKTIRKLLPKGSILDVGCFRGDFLSILPDNYDKYGVEPSKQASRLAKLKGIEMIGTSIESITTQSARFDIITLLDVMEHLVNPFRSLQILFTKLNSNGFVILTTGNTNALPWRLMRTDYWYYYPEHVSFFCPQWFHWAGPKIGFKVTAISKFSHFSSKWFQRWKHLSQSIVYVLLKRGNRYPRLLNFLSHIYPFSRARGWEEPPETKFWKDHMLVVLRSCS